MKTFNQYITEKLIINKNLKKVYDWDSDIDYFFIVTFNSNRQFFIDLRTLNNQYNDKFEKRLDYKYDFKSYKSLTALIASGARVGTFTESESGEFLYEVRKSKDRYSLFFYTLIIHPIIFKTYDLNWLNYNKTYNIEYILDNLHINKKEVPLIFFKYKDYIMSNRQGTLEKTKEIISELK